MTSAFRSPGPLLRQKRTSIIWPTQHVDEGGKPCSSAFTDLVGMCFPADQNESLVWLPWADLLCYHRTGPTSSRQNIHRRVSTYSDVLME